MNRYGRISCAIAMMLAMAGCSQPLPPPNEVLTRGMAEALIDTGFYEEVSINRIIGQHYNSAENKWQIYACFQFRLADGTQGTNCVDSISALELTNGGWIVSATINEVYRWRAITLMPEAGSQSGSPDSPGQ